MIIHYLFLSDIHKILEIIQHVFGVIYTRFFLVRLQTTYFCLFLLSKYLPECQNQYNLDCLLWLPRHKNLMQFVHFIFEISNFQGTFVIPRHYVGKETQIGNHVSQTGVSAHHDYFYHIIVIWF